MMPQHGRALGRLAAAAAASAATGEREGEEGHCNMNLLILFLSFALDKFPLSFLRDLACEERGVKGNEPQRINNYQYKQNEAQDEREWSDEGASVSHTH